MILFLVSQDFVTAVADHNYRGCKHNAGWNFDDCSLFGLELDISQINAHHLSFKDCRAVVHSDCRSSGQWLVDHEQHTADIVLCNILECEADGDASDSKT